MEERHREGDGSEVQGDGGADTGEQRAMDEEHEYADAEGGGVTAVCSG